MTIFLKKNQCVSNLNEGSIVHAPDKVSIVQGEWVSMKHSFDAFLWWFTGWEQVFLDNIKGTYLALCSLKQIPCNQSQETQFLFWNAFVKISGWSFTLPICHCNCLSLVLTGAEAMFADLGHFSVRSIQVRKLWVTYLILPSRLHPLSCIDGELADCIYFCGIPLPSASLHGPSLIPFEISNLSQ